MTDREVVTISLPSRAEHLDLLQRVAEETARVSGFDEEAQLDVGLAVREGAVNAMKHGNRFDVALPVRISIETSAEKIRVEITDCGEGFDLNEAPDPTSAENLWRESGRGLLLIRSLVDALDYQRGNGESTLVLEKRRRVAGASPPGNAERPG